jgi:hypothetical protein
MTAAEFATLAEKAAKAGHGDVLCVLLLTGSQRLGLSIPGELEEVAVRLTADLFKGRALGSGAHARNVARTSVARQLLAVLAELEGRDRPIGPETARHVCTRALLAPSVPQDQVTQLVDVCWAQTATVPGPERAQVAEAIVSGYCSVGGAHADVEAALGWAARAADEGAPVGAARTFLALSRALSEAGRPGESLDNLVAAAHAVAASSEDLDIPLLRALFSEALARDESQLVDTLLETLRETGRGSDQVLTALAGAVSARVTVGRAEEVVAERRALLARHAAGEGVGEEARRAVEAADAALSAILAPPPPPTPSPSPSPSPSLSQPEEEAVAATESGDSSSTPTPPPSA